MAGPRDLRLLWITLLLLQASMAVFMIGDGRIVRGRETGRALESERGSGGGILQRALLVAPDPSSPAASPTLFYLGLWLDELILLLGAWLLARSLFADPRTAFFVGVAAVGSFLWVDHAWTNFRTFHALPLLLHLIRCFRIRRSPALLFAALNLAALQALGKPASQALLTPAAALLLLIAFRRVLLPGPDPASATPSARKLRIALAAGLASWIAVIVSLAAVPRSAPAADAPPFLQGILGFSSLDNPATLLDAVMGVAPVPDFTMYCGFLTAAFAALALVRLGAMPSLRMLGTAAAVLLALGVVATAGDLLLPDAGLQRRSSGGAPLLRLLMIFLAGLGFDGTLRRRPAPDRAVSAISLALLAAGLALAAVSLRLRTIMNLEGTAAAFFVPRAPAGTISPEFRDLIVIRELFDMSAVWALIAAGLFLLAHRPGRAAPLAIALILLLHPLDVFGWKFRMTWVRSDAAAEAAPARMPEERRPAVAAPPAAPRSVPVRIGDALLGLNALAWVAGAAALALRKAIEGGCPAVLRGSVLHARSAG